VRVGDTIVLIAGFSHPLVVGQDRLGVTKLISPANVLDILSHSEARVNELVTKLQNRDLEDIDLS
jgi:hypothetical protein